MFFVSPRDLMYFGSLYEITFLFSFFDGGEGGIDEKGKYLKLNINFSYHSIKLFGFWGIALGNMGFAGVSTWSCVLANVCWSFWHFCLVLFECTQEVFRILRLKGIQFEKIPEIPKIS